MMGKRILVLGIFLFGLALASGVFAASASGYSGNWQSYQPTFDRLYSGDMSNYWPILSQMENDQCNATSDFIIGIPPGGCTPGVVRSDLLEEQNVPVFCQLYAIKINPLIKVSSIKSISFKGDYPEGVRSVVFHPARAAVRSYTTLLGDPTLNNIGYVVIILKQNRVEDNMEEWIAGNLTATIRYDAEEAYGTAAGDYYLPDMSDDEWNADYASSSFWNGRGYLRAGSIDDGRAVIQLFTSKDKIVRTFNLKEGETSALTYLPGYYCRAGLKIKLNKIVVPEDMALLNIDGQSIWVREGTKFLEKCSVRKLDVVASNEGEIDIKCTGSGTIEPLSLRGKGVLLKMDEKEYREHYIGEKVEGKGKYVVYYGTYPAKGEDESKEFAVLAYSMMKRDEIKSILNKSKSFEDFKAGVEKIKVSSGISVLSNEDSFFGGLVDDVKDVESNKNVDNYFKLANDSVDELVSAYRSEMKENGEAFGEEALYEQIKLAGHLGKFKTQAGLMDVFVEKYPLSKIVEQVRNDRRKLKGTDFSNSFVSVYVGDKFRSIGVVDFKSVDEGAKKVDLRIRNIDYPDLGEGWNETLGKVGTIEVVEILPGKVKVSFDSATQGVRTLSRTISEGKRETFEGIEVYVKNVEVNEVAHVSLVPEVKHTKTEADFTFKIGIEKRAIELSPERAKKMLKNINESIVEWEKIVDRLGNVVKGLKGACFATSAYLMIKNMATGFDGEAMARQKVMMKYKAICDGKSEYRTRTECYNSFSNEIDADVVAMTTALNSVNKRMDDAMKDNIGDSGGLFGGKGVVDNAEYKKDLVEKIDGEFVVIEVDGEEVKVSLDDLSVSQLRAVMLNQELGGEGIVGDIARAEMEHSLRNVALMAQQTKKEKELGEEFIFGKGDGRIAFPVSVLMVEQERFIDGGLRVTGDKLQGAVNGNLGLDKNVKYGAQIVSVNSKNYLYVFNVKGAQKGVWEVGRDGDKLILGEKKDNLPSTEGAQVSIVARGSCSYPWPKGEAKVSYYEYGDNKGLPAIVPFDLVEGWYAMVPNSGGTFLDSSPQGYTASADIRHFTICNIGPNYLMQNGQGDDLCQMFNVNTIGSVDKFIPCPDVDVKTLYNKAREAIRRASDQSGQRVINIFDQMMELGEPMSQVGGFECQDFMSPDDCLLMFNVCDPVICPPSRCNLGGKMPVSDVIQTGIIGSLVLCLPNAAEGVIVPICLSGVHAGLGAYLSILKSEAECLQHSLDTGEMIGICDEITSIYMCEFFWRQLSPVMDQLFPGLIAGMISPGQRVRGGGEYALVQQSWNTMRSSVDYFKGVYAQNAFRAFNIRSVEEVGSTLCKAFVGTSFPGSADILDSLLEPESPSQFYAQFSETLFTEATVPATSQYKVYYHIYAGNDQGVQYKVYLKNPPETSYYVSNPSVLIKSGYIAKGSSADETVDFTAPAGYKELCVVINAKEECGFKQVSTSFALDYVKSKFVEEQVESSEITSEKECISGSPSALSLVNLNLQAGAEEMVNPEIALRGIVRVCASQNPAAGVVSGDYVVCANDTDCGKGFSCGKSGYCEYVDESGMTRQKVGSRWKDVGYCGDSSMRCWLDVDSVKDDLRAIEVIENTSSSILDERRGLIERGNLNLEQVQKMLASVRGRIKGLMSNDLLNPTGDKVNKIVGELDEIIGRDAVDDIEASPGAGTNGDRAEALALKATVYRMIVMEMKKGEIVERVIEPRDAVEGKKDDEVEGEAKVKVDVTADSLASLMTERSDCDCGDKCEEYAENIMNYSEKYEIDDPLRVLAVMIQESGCKYDAVSGAGSYGLMQIEGRSFEDICRGKLSSGYDGDFNSIRISPERTEQNIECGVKILRKKYDDYKDGVEESWAYKTSSNLGGFSSSVRDCIDDQVNYKSYIKWDAALRGYNGWGCGEGADVDYVEKVLVLMGEITERFSGSEEEIIIGVSFWKDGEKVVKVTQASDVEIVVEGGGCEDVLFDIYESGSLSAEEKKTNLGRVRMFFYEAKPGEYFVEAYCYKNSQIVGSKKSSILTIEGVGAVSH